MEVMTQTVLEILQKILPVVSGWKMEEALQKILQIIHKYCQTHLERVKLIQKKILPVIPR